MFRVYIGYLVLKVALHIASPNLWQKFESYVELTTPINSYLNSLEGVYLYKDLNISPYSGSVFRQSPLLLSLFSLCPQNLHFLLFLIADLIGAFSLASVAKANPKLRASPFVIAAIYLFNPFSLLSGMAMTTQTFSNALICLSLYFSKRPVTSWGLLCLAGVLTFYPFYLLPALSVYLAISKWKALLISLVSTIALLLISWLPLQSFEFLDSQFGSLLQFRDLTRPNIGMWWYFFIEMFDFFRPFYLCAFQLFVCSLSVPLAIRFEKQPIFGFAACLGFINMFKPYPDASDIGMYGTLLFLNAYVLDAMEFKPISFVALIYVSVLSPVFYYLWIYMGSGNSNFYYGMNLALSIILTMILVDSVSAAARCEYGTPDKTALI